MSFAFLSYALAASTSADNAVKTLKTMYFDNLEQHWNDDDHPTAKLRSLLTSIKKKSGPKGPLFFLELIGIEPTTY